MKLICEAVTVHSMGVRSMALIPNGADGQGEENSFPPSFLWRGRLYRVRGVLVCWRWRGAWWTTPNLLGHERTYFQVLCGAPGGSQSGSEMCVELYEERGRWVLSRLLD